MRIGIDARKLHDFGIGTYIRNIVRQLTRLDGQTEYVLICQSRDRDLAGSLGPNFRVVTDDSPPYSIRTWADPSTWPAGWNDTLTPFRLKLSP